MSHTVLETSPQSPPDACQVFVDQLNAWADLPTPGGQTKAFTVETFFSRKHTAPAVSWAVLDDLISDVVTMPFRQAAHAAIGTVQLPGPLVLALGMCVSDVEDLVASGYRPRPPEPRTTSD